jgi:hypothetical protein
MLCGLNLYPGPKDDSLTWPFNKCFMMSVVDVDNNAITSDWCDPSTEDDEDSIAAFAKPGTDNQSAYGFFMFAWSECNENDLIIADRMRVVLRIGPAELLNAATTN